MIDIHPFARLVALTTILILSFGLAAAQTPFAGPHTVTLTWSQGTVPASTYHIKRATNPSGPWIQIAIVPPGTGSTVLTSYVDTASAANPLPEGATFFYRVYAVRSDGSETAPANTDNATECSVLQATGLCEAAVMIPMAVTQVSPAQGLKAIAH